MRTIKKFKKGAASFYIVAFSTLILLVIATSFAAIIISEISRTANNDLSQSAYDSALAGIEDAKLAVYNYQECLKNNKTGCDGIIANFENPTCDMISQTLGRSSEIIESTNVGNNMQQAYTCVKIDKSPPDYRSTLSSTRVVRPKFSSYKDAEGLEHTVSANDIKKIRINWYSDKNATASGFRYTNFNADSVYFPTPTTSFSIAAPPTISLGLIQTGPSFTLADFDVTRGSETDRGMIYMVPTSNATVAAKTKKDNYNGTTYDTKEQTSQISANAIRKSNTKTISNLPYAVYCPKESDAEFACSATIELPDPIGKIRNDDTFMIVVASPYGRPDVDFSLEFFCADDGKPCAMDPCEDDETCIEAKKTSRANLENIQVKVDSTGRANDLYRRVQARFENSDTNSLSIIGPLELLGADNILSNEPLLRKDMAIIKEYNFNMIP